MTLHSVGKPQSPTETPGTPSSLVARQEEGAAAVEAVGTFVAGPARPAAGRRRTYSQPAGANLHRMHLSVVTAHVNYMFSYTFPKQKSLREPQPTLLRHSTVVHGRLLRWITPTAVLLLGSIHLRMRRHGVGLLGVTVGHLGHPRSGHAVPSAHPVGPHDAAAARRVPSTGSIVRCLVHTDRATVEPVDGTIKISLLMVLRVHRPTDGQ